MEFEYDDVKSEKCLEERSFDFEYARGIFDDPDGVETQDTRYDYGEPRYVKIGKVGEDIITVVWTPRNGKTRIITAWPASKQERKRYGDAQI